MPSSNSSSSKNPLATERSTNIEVGPVSANVLEQALRLVFESDENGSMPFDLGEVARSVKNGTMPLGGFIAATAGNVLLGAGWATLAAGRVASLWPARLVAGASEEIADEIHRQLEQFLRARRTTLCQTLLPSAEGVVANRLRRVGIDHACDLVYLAADRDSFPQENPVSGLEWIPYSSQIHDVFAAVVERTYEGTADCPVLNGVRQIDDVLASYRDIGHYAPENWLLVRQNNTDVGCLLLSDHPTEKHYELVYLGVLPQSRGQGLGVQLTRFAKWRAQVAKAHRLVLAVDAANAPALAAYAACEFQAFSRRSVFLKRFA